jgi:hypothetical protein
MGTVTADVPQPGETPRHEGDPWPFAESDGGWWPGESDRQPTDAPTGRPRHPRRRAPQALPATGGTGILLPPGYPRGEEPGEVPGAAPGDEPRVPDTAENHERPAAEAHPAGVRDAAPEAHTAGVRDDAPDPHAAGVRDVAAEFTQALGQRNDGPPTDQSPVQQPPAQQPPAQQPPTQQPPSGQTPAQQPPAQQPPAQQPPSGPTPAQQPPAQQPPAQQPPVQQRPTQQPPAQQPSSRQPPAQQGSARRSAAHESPVEQAGVERDHHRPDPYRYDPLRPPAGHTAKVVPATVAADADGAATPPAEKSEGAGSPASLAGQLDAGASAADQRDGAASPAGEPGREPLTGPQPPDAQDRPDAADVPDVMVLPEPNDRSRPTVALDRGPVPGQSSADRSWPANGSGRHTEPLPRPTGSAAIDARLAKLENSPFWLTEQERADQPPALDGPAHTAVRSRRSPRHADRHPATALLALVTLALVAAFFAWVSAEPFWLAVGHGERGYATTASCTGTGVTQRCTGRFAAADGGYSVGQVTLLGVSGDRRANGATADARMVSPDSRQVYLGDTGVLVHLRWILGFVLVLFCGYGIAGLTGARRLESARARRGAVLVSLAGPLLLLAGFLLAAY